eukprot:CAMPEP_0185857838 /NCGR_PEP_ID=MMETSP1354-20130828/29706_1 /TAXON_ID=708628 /ORGANISM="Erythrolobus madagascarensis, Strain CCMP3276" /LENGTH=264 /DNA_ID=CAMNT_0028560109 /DNA_START=76 /DNA_END=870 /DNA_ORIENTATION=+
MVRARHVVLGVGMYAAGVGIAVLLRPGMSTPSVGDESAVSAEERAKAFTTRAGEYDAHVARSERFLGIDSLRRRLVRHTHAATNVIEIAAGSGRNAAWYRSSTEEPHQLITWVDTSAEMLSLAQTQATNRGLHVNTKVADAEDLAPFPDDCFDVVLDTFGLCSVSDPQGVLREMKRICAPGGQILLLEHGRATCSPNGSDSWWPPRALLLVMNRVLDFGAQQHALKWGCWWNRDIHRAIKDANMQVKRYETHHIGTTHFVILEP